MKEEDKNKDKYYQELMNYLGLETIEEAKLFEILESEYLQMGQWGSKIITYLRAILSRNKRYTSYIQEEDQDLFKKIMKDSLDVLKLELENYDKLQGINTQPERGSGESSTD